MHANGCITLAALPVSEGTPSTQISYTQGPENIVSLSCGGPRCGVVWVHGGLGLPAASGQELSTQLLNLQSHLGKQK